MSFTCADDLVETAGDHYVAALRADTIVLWCNSSTTSEPRWTHKPAPTWTHRPTNENRTYTYANGSIPGRYGTDGRFSVITGSDGGNGDYYGLRIYNAQLGDSGRYECYDIGNVLRSVHQLNVTGTYRFFSAL